MAQVRVRLKARRQININNDLGGAAFYFKNRVDHRIEKDHRDGISFEIMAGLTFLAFEAKTALFRDRRRDSPRGITFYTFPGKTPGGARGLRPFFH